MHVVYLVGIPGRRAGSVMKSHAVDTWLCPMREEGVGCGWFHSEAGRLGAQPSVPTSWPGAASLPSASGFGNLRPSGAGFSLVEQNRGGYKWLL